MSSRASATACLTGRTLRLTTLEDDAEPRSPLQSWSFHPRRRRPRLKAVAHVIIALRRLNPPRGVRLEHVLAKQKGSLSDGLGDLEEDALEFAMEFVGSLPLMWKSTKMFVGLQDLLAEGSWPREDLLWRALAHCTYQMKLAAVKQCWQRHVRPMRHELQALKERYEGLRAQWKTARTSYLREVTTLRDELRPRSDPEAKMPQGGVDIISFYDPSSSLEPSELSFLVEVVKEKMKMMLESNPAVSQGANLSQLQTMLQARDGHEVQHLKARLKDREDEIKELQRTVAELESIVGGDQRKAGEMPARGTGTSAAAAAKVLALEAQIDQLRSQLRGEAANEIFKHERDELRTAYDLEAQERMSLQSQNETLRARCESVEAARLRLQKEADALRDQLENLACEDRELRAKLSRGQVVRLRDAVTRRGERDREERDAARDAERERLQAEQAAYEAQQAQRPQEKEIVPEIPRKPTRRLTFPRASELLRFAVQRMELASGQSPLIGDEEGATSLTREGKLLAASASLKKAKAALEEEKTQLESELEGVRSDLRFLKRANWDLRKDEARRIAEESMQAAGRFLAIEQGFLASGPELQGLEAARSKDLAAIESLQQVLAESHDPSQVDEDWLNRVNEARMQVVVGGWELREAEMKAALAAVESQGSKKRAGFCQGCKELTEVRQLLQVVSEHGREMGTRLADAEVENLKLTESLQEFRDRAAKSVSVLKSSAAAVDPKVRATISGFEELGKSAYERLAKGDKWQSQRFAAARQRYAEESQKAIEKCVKLDRDRRQEKRTGDRPILPLPTELATSEPTPKSSQQPQPSQPMTTPRGPPGRPMTGGQSVVLVKPTKENFLLQNGLPKTGPLLERPEEEQQRGTSESLASDECEATASGPRQAGRHTVPKEPPRMALPPQQSRAATESWDADSEVTSPRLPSAARPTGKRTSNMLSVPSGQSGQMTARRQSSYSSSRVLVDDLAKDQILPDVDVCSGWERRQYSDPGTLREPLMPKLAEGWTKRNMPPSAGTAGGLSPLPPMSQKPNGTVERRLIGLPI